MIDASGFLPRLTKLQYVSCERRYRHRHRFNNSDRLGLGFDSRSVYFLILLNGEEFELKMKCLFFVCAVSRYYLSRYYLWVTTHVELW